jgi:hypothetical protein
MKPSNKTDKSESVDQESHGIATASIAATRRRVGAVLFLMMIAVLLTSTLLVIGGVLVFRNLEARLWKHTDGVLIDAHIDRHDQTKDQKPDIPVVKYAYSVDGHRVISDKWSPAGYGLDIYGSVESLKKQNPLVVYYNPRNAYDSAVVLPPVNIGFFPFVLGLGMFLILVVAIGGGALYAALHPDDAAKPDSRARGWIVRSLRAGFALIVTSMTGLVSLLYHSPGGWWQWLLSGAAVVYALTRPL